MVFGGSGKRFVLLSEQDNAIDNGGCKSSEERTGNCAKRIQLRSNGRSQEFTAAGEVEACGGRSGRSFDCPEMGGKVQFIGAIVGRFLLLMVKVAGSFLLIEERGRKWWQENLIYCGSGILQFMLVSFVAEKVAQGVVLTGERGRNGDKARNSGGRMQFMVAIVGMLAGITVTVAEAI